MKNKCPKCGTKRSHGYDLCFTCGYKFFSESRQIPTISDKKVEKSFTTCPHCRQKLPLGAKFCVTCGQKVEDLKPIPPISAIKGRNSQIHLNWLKHQYYDLGKTMQDIANDQNVSMMTIRKLLERIEAISEKEEVKSMIDVPTLKTEEVQPIPQVSDIKEETPKIIPTEEVKPRPPVLEKKVEEPKKSSDVQFFPPISELLQGEKTSKPIPSVSELKTEDTQTASLISEKKVKKSFTTCPHCRQKLHLRAKFCFNCGQKVEVLKPIPPISDIEEETPKITLAEEIQPIPPVYVKKEEKRKKEPRVCKFCGMRLPKNKAFCLQCGMIIKIK